jgi:hypothetical protein
MEEISWNDRVRNEEVLNRVKRERSILQNIKRRKASWIYHILCRNCLLKHVIEGKTEGRIDMTKRRQRRRKLIPGDSKEKRWYWQAPDRTLCSIRFGRGYGPVVGQTAEWLYRVSVGQGRPVSLVTEIRSAIKRRELISGTVSCSTASQVARVVKDMKLHLEDTAYETLAWIHFLATLVWTHLWSKLQRQITWLYS